MKQLLILPVLLLLGGCPVATNPFVKMPDYPPTVLQECKELEQTVIDATADGVSLEVFYKEKIALNKQYADCASMHNELIRFIKKQQDKKAKN
tara:strand:- start:1119 stop:1397 length:279 start_codon:yes stop_codon:yes gene_type:complete